MTTRRAHWQSIYRDRDPTGVSWYQENPARSLILIGETGVPADAPIIDIGGGASRLVDRLLDLGYRALTVLDVAPASLTLARERLGARAADVSWIESDVLAHTFERRYAVWHDRAVFHFLTEEADRGAYVEKLRSAVVAGGYAIVATFGLDGPEQCSGLPVQRYDSDSLAGALGPAFEPVRFHEEAHRTPAGGRQHFLYGSFRRVQQAHSSTSSAVPRAT